MITRLLVSCPAAGCPWTVDTVVQLVDPAELQAQADRCAADHVRLVHPELIPTVQLQANPPQEP